MKDATVAATRTEAAVAAIGAAQDRFHITNWSN